MSDPFELPGMIKERTIVNIDDVSSDDDGGTNAWLKSGPAKKKALAEKERIKNLSGQAEGTKPSHATITLAMASSTCLVFILFAAQKATISVCKEPSPRALQRGRTGEAEAKLPLARREPPVGAWAHAPGRR